MFRIFSISICLLVCAMVIAQENRQKILTLEESIDIALQNNLDLQSVKLNENRSKVNYVSSRADLLPNLNANYNIGVNNGRSINPFTNSFINRELTFSIAGLNLEATVFSGFQLLNRIKQNKLAFKASQFEVQEAKQNLILNVTLAYLRVLNNRDLVQLAENRLATTIEQVNRLETLYNEEIGNPADYSDIQGQYALERTALIQEENTLKQSVLDLAQLLNIGDNISLEGITMLVDLEFYTYSPSQIMEEALQNQPAFKARELRVEEAKTGVKVARAQYTPTFSIFAQVNTNYSSAAQIFLETGSALVETGGFVTIDNQNIPVLTNQTQFAEAGISYEDQFNNNLSTAVGVSLSIPILNGLNVRNNVALQKINHEESLVDLENNILQFKQAIKQAHNDMEAAFHRFEIFKEQVKVYEESFRVNEIRFNSGVSNIIEYTISKNNLENARINLANAKYEYLLRVKVLDYYRGVV